MKNITPPPNLVPVETQTTKKVPTWLALLILLSCAALAAFVFITLMQKVSVDFSLETEVTSRSQIVVNSYLGEITKVDKDGVTFLAEAYKNNYLNQDLLLVAQIKSTTQITVLTLPEKIDARPLAEQITKKELKFSDLKVGQIIKVLSAENIYRQTTFDVDLIEVQDVK
jgi:hypothetical protein